MASYIFALALIFLCVVRADDASLRFVFTLVNTGTTTPSIPVPTMSWDDWDEKAPGELTAMGMREQYLLGHELRRQYDEAGLINPDYMIDQIFFRMIDHNATIESGEAFIRGFIKDNSDLLSSDEKEKALPPLKVNQYFINNIGSNVLPLGVGTLPYHTHYPHEKDVFAPRSCMKAQEMTHNSFMNNTEVEQIVKKYHAQFVEMVKLRFPDIDPKKLVFPLYLPLLESIYKAVKQFREMELSEKEQSLVENYVAELYFYSRAGNMLANSYLVSQALSVIKTYIKSGVDNELKRPNRTENLKSAFIFTEERMIVSLLSHLGYNVTNPLAPASIVAFQLYGAIDAESSDDFYIKLKYNDEEKRIGDCGFPTCEYERFMKTMEKLIVVDAEVKCK